MQYHALTLSKEVMTNPSMLVKMGVGGGVKTVKYVSIFKLLKCLKFIKCTHHLVNTV